MEAVALGGGGGSSGVARLLGWLVRRHNLTAFMLYTAGECVRRAWGASVWREGGRRGERERTSTILTPCPPLSPPLLSPLHSLALPGLVAFVLGLDRGRTLAPFRSFAWAHLTLLFLVLPSSFFVSNLFEGGIIWFLLPASLVIVNDIAAYVAGFFCGRTPLIAVSPKKTWEGFLGGAVGTVGASWVLADFMSRPPWLTCPRTDLSFLAPLACDPGPVYAPRLYALADALPAGALEGDFGAGVAAAAARLAALTFTARPMQLHAVALAAFASLLAPFGGFFASGLKRAFKVKDFGHSIPGHGGMTDRMDCQIVMAVFSSLYLHAFVFPGWGGGGGGAGSSVAALAAAAAALGGRDQLALLAALARGVAGAGLLGGEGAGALEAVAAAAAAAAEGGGDLVAAGDE